MNNWSRVTTSRLWVICQRALAGRGGIILALILGVVSGAPACQSSPADKVITRELVLVDQAGHPRAHLAMRRPPGTEDIDPEPELALFRPDGTRSVTLRQRPIVATPELVLHDSQGKDKVVLDVNLGVDGSESSRLRLLGNDGLARVRVGDSDTLGGRGGAITLYRDDGYPAVSLGVGHYNFIIVSGNRGDGRDVMVSPQIGEESRHTSRLTDIERRMLIELPDSPFLELFEYMREDLVRRAEAETREAEALRAARQSMTVPQRLDEIVELLEEVRLTVESVQESMSDLESVIHRPASFNAPFPSGHDTDEPVITPRLPLP